MRQSIVWIVLVALAVAVCFILQAGRYQLHFRDGELIYKFDKFTGRLWEWSSPNGWFELKGETKAVTFENIPLASEKAPSQ